MHDVWSDCLLNVFCVFRFARPPPVVSTIHVILSHTMSIPYYRDDYHVSYANFLTTIPVELQYTKAAIETNRCFFIHLGIAMGLHPFLIQSWLRIVSKMMLRQAEQGTPSLLFHVVYF